MDNALWKTKDFTEFDGTSTASTTSHLLQEFKSPRVRKEYGERPRTDKTSYARSSRSTRGSLD